MATGTAQTALVGFVVIWSLTKRLQIHMIHYNVHNANIDVSLIYTFILYNRSYGLNFKYHYRACRLISSLVVR
jgi:hypothetical protein